MDITQRDFSGTGEGKNRRENVQGTNSDRKETRTQSNDLEQKEKKIHPEENEETRI